jgi:hypothetical protein
MTVYADGFRTTNTLSTFASGSFAAEMKPAKMAAEMKPAKAAAEMKPAKATAVLTASMH